MEKKLKRRQEMEENKKNKVKSQVKKMEVANLKTKNIFIQLLNLCLSFT
jgi:hypothetical protein